MSLLIVGNVISPASLARHRGIIFIPFSLIPKYYIINQQGLPVLHPKYFSSLFLILPCAPLQRSGKAISLHWEEWGPSTSLWPGSPRPDQIMQHVSKSLSAKEHLLWPGFVISVHNGCNHLVGMVQEREINSKCQCSNHPVSFSSLSLMTICLYCH